VLLAVVVGSGVSRHAVGWLPVLGAIAAIAAAAVAIAAYLHLRRRGAFERFAAIVRPFAQASRIIATGLGARLLLVSLVIWTLEGCLFALCGAALDLDVNVMEGLLLVVLANFFALIPAAPGYVGTYDAAVLFGTRAIGVRAGDAVGLALLARLISFVPVTLAGLVLLITRYGGLRRLREAR